MGARTSGRAVALHVLFGLDARSAGEEAEAGLSVGEDGGGEAAIAAYFRSFEDPEVHADGVEPDARAFAEDLLRDIVPLLPKID